MDNESIELKENDFPDIVSYLNNGNPTLRSPNSSYELPLLQTKESFADIDFYGQFIHNVISQFRKLRVYKNYKNYLMTLGLDHCQYLHNINSSMANLEMNHCIITIFDVALMITEHMINTYGYVSSCHVVAALREEHTSNRIPLVIMCKTVHQLYHNDDLFYVHPKQVYGKWVELFSKYRNGITPEICVKVLYYLRTAFEETGSTDNDLLEIGETIKNWSEATYASNINIISNQNPYNF